MLVQSFWRGELVASLGNPATIKADQRELALDVLKQFPDHPGLVVVESQSKAPPAIIVDDDGSEWGDPRAVIIWPADTKTRNGSLLKQACENLAAVDWCDYHDDFKVMLSELLVLRADFQAFCRAKGYRLPAFWSGDAKPNVAAQAKIDCRNWLRQEVRQLRDAKPMRKAAYRAEAREQFRDLTARAFDKIWEATVPDRWKRPGAPPGPRSKAGSAPRKS
ncbi:hypothetical protein OL599_24785 [Rhodovastum sp. RN2-1]|uniref:Uncharacterized protein n=1 Tax=Limobrevibacterium gyesilva TaxID=2991712 RepID=A0AA41YPP2_9PROT|nr:hypothetical protein [Limobrevibacterium gyesilva]